MKESDYDFLQVRRNGETTGNVASVTPYPTVLQLSVILTKIGSNIILVAAPVKMMITAVTVLGLVHVGIA